MQKSIAYFNNKAKIDKAFHSKTAYKIQFYNNNKVDELIKNFDTSGVSSKPPKAVLTAELSILNKPEVYKNYNRIINSKFTSNDNFFKMLVRNKAQTSLDNVVKNEVERISKNLDYVEQVLKKYEVPTKEYEKLVKQQAEKSLANRRQILEDVTIKANDLLVSEGLNIPSVYSYRDLETSAQSLLRESQMTAGFEEAQSINQNYIDEGKSAIYNSKVWIHTHGGETTRHMSNHMQRVKFDEPFIVVNDKTLDIDEMMYPCDPAGSPSNSYICYCEVEYENDDSIESDTVSLGQSVFDVAKPEILSPTPAVTFSNTVSSLKDKMPTITSVPQFIQHNKVSDFIKNNPIEESKVKPIGEPININQATIYNELDILGDGRYSVEPSFINLNKKGNYEYRGIEIKHFDENNVPILTKNEILNHNNQFKKNYNNKPIKKIGEDNTLNKEVINEFNRFADETRHNDYESVMFTDNNGNVILERTDFKENTVSYNYKDLTKIMEENHILGDLNNNHNHPTRAKDSAIYEFPTMFSLADVSHMFDIEVININGNNLTITPQKSISVEYCNGMRMTLERAEGNGISNHVLDDFMDSGLSASKYKLTKDNLKDFSTMTELKEEFYDAYSELNKAYFDFLKKGENMVEDHIFEYMDKKIESGEYNPETATGEQYKAFQNELKNEEQRFAKELARDENNSFNKEFKYQAEVFKELGFNLSMEWLY